MKIIWSPLAVQRMTEIADYISRDNPTTAVNWAKAVFEKIENIVEFPYMERVVPEADRNEIRELIFKNYRIIYRVEIDHISILTIRHGRRLFSSEESESQILSNLRGREQAVKTTQSVKDGITMRSMVMRECQRQDYLPNGKAP